MKQIHGVIFDFDGVIADTETVFAAFDCDLLNEVLEDANRLPSLTPKDVRALAGNNDEGKLRLIARQNNFNADLHLHDFVAKRTELRKTLFKDHPAPMAKNLPALLDKLGTQRSALATNKVAAKLYHDLDLMQLTDLFKTIITCDPPYRKKPEADMLLAAADQLGLAPQQCAYVGDNTLDMHAAKNAGMMAVGFVIDGIEDHQHRAKALDEHGAEIILDDFIDLIPYVTSP